MAGSNVAQQVLDELVAEQKLSAAQAAQVLELSAKQNREVDEILHSLNLVDGETFATAKAKLFNLPYVDLRNARIPKRAMDLIPLNVAQSNKLIGYALPSEGTLAVAFVAPENLAAAQVVEFLLRKSNLQGSYAVCSQSAWQEAMKQYQGLNAEVAEELSVAATKFSQGELADDGSGGKGIEAVIRSAPVAKIVSVIIKHAVEGGASDIHIEPAAKESRVRYRVDGILHTTLTLPLYLHPAVISRIKVMANLKLDETRKPQDGRIRLDVDGRTVDFRISTLPLIDNEKVVMRILDNSTGVGTLGALGFNATQEAVLTSAIKKSHGMVLVTGPTGAGKTTTLYALLNLLNHDEVNIVTLEDPIEYYLSGINQSQIYPDIGFTFATGLRSILRQDPNVIMLGEIRDRETAELAVHAALTGHLMLSTLHTGDALGVIPRLIDMHVEPFLLASTLEAVVAQRLVRRICPDCVAPTAISPEYEAEVRAEFAKLPAAVQREYGVADGAALTFSRGAGCDRCGDTGYRDRIVIAELFGITPAIEALIVRKFSQQDLRDALAAQNMISIKQDGLLKALKGLTTVEEVLRVTRE